MYAAAAACPYLRLELSPSYTSTSSGRSFKSSCLLVLPSHEAWSSGLRVFWSSSLSFAGGVDPTREESIFLIIPGLLAHPSSTMSFRKRGRLVPVGSRGGSFMAQLTGKTLLKLGLVGLLAWMLFASGVLVAEASHNFSDVPTSAFYHTAVDWIVARAITAGCAVGLYCPDNAVTRGQMAVFLQKEGLALTPIFIGSQQEGFAPITWSAQPNLCQTPDHTPSFPQRAFLTAHASVQSPAAGPTDWAHNVYYSTTGGSTWLPTGNFPMRVTSGAGEYAHTGGAVTLDLAAGTSYRFAIHFFQITGQPMSGGWYCELKAMIVNRNP